MATGPSIRQIECFIAVAEELHFRRAAERLHVTQPPLSRQIRRLEDLLGARLFDRDRRSVRLTDAGQRFLDDARAIRQQSEQAVTRARAGSAPGHRRVVRLAITTVVDVDLFAGAAERFAARVPGARLVVRRQSSAQSIRELRRGAVDVAVVGLPVKADGLTLEPLCDDPLVACLPSRHRLARRRRISVLDLADDPLFWFERRLHPAYHDHCQTVFARVGFHGPRIPEPADHHVLLGLVAQGQGVALVPRSLKAIRRDGVVFREVVEGSELRIRLAVAWRRDDPDAAVGALVGVLRERAGDERAGGRTRRAGRATASR